MGGLNAYHLSRQWKALSRVVIVFALLSFQAVAEDLVVKISDFSSGNLEHWDTKVFKDLTHYRIVEQNNRKVLQANSQAAASGLYRELRIDLDKTPYLNWSWRIENTLDGLNEQSKSGDDYAARVYVIVSGGFAFWRTKALNYVWSGNSPKGMSWANAFAGDNAIMLALRSREDSIGSWVFEKRNVKADLSEFFGENIPYIDAIAIMTDTDNSKGRATAYYSEIYFSAE